MQPLFSARLLRLLVLTLLTAAGLVTTACKKDSEPAADYSAADDAAIQKYLAANNITTAQKQPSGLYFVPTVTNASGTRATAGSNVSVLYTGRLLDGTIFDASSQHGNVPLSFVLGRGQLIPGFEEGIALLHVGDKAELLLPSALAYGSAGNPTAAIPANAVLRFEVELVDINFAITDNAIIAKYLADNKITTAQKQPSGLYFVPGTTNAGAAQATAGKTASVLYTGTLLNGTVFDASSKNGNTPLSFVVGAKQVVPGFDEGISLLHKGEKAVLLIPSALAYGPAGAGTSVAPNTVLRFEVELVDVK